MTGAKLEQVGVQMNVTLGGSFERIDFRKAPVRKAMDRIGRVVRFRARRMVARRAVSRPGDYPGLDSGDLLRSINYKVSKSGFMVLIQPDKITGMEAFYPAFLWSGTRNRRRGGTLEKRDNYMVDAMNYSAPYIRRELHAALVEGLKD